MFIDDLFLYFMTLVNSYKSFSDCDRLQYKRDILEITECVFTLSPGSWQREELRSDHDVPIVTAGTRNFTSQNLFHVEHTV